MRTCESEATQPPSYKVFCKEVNKRPERQQILKRRGHRAAYQLEPPYLEIELTTPRHGDRPFQICHLDHTELDVELVCSRTGQNLGRPWLTIFTDAFSRRFLAIYLSFDPPSYRACMMALRECVRRHNRLPQVVIVDGGKEFESVYFEALLARYECTKKTRPPAKARFGSVCERLVGTTNTQFVYSLCGNTQITKNVRQVTASVNPRNHAVWTLDRLYNRLAEWAHQIYDNTVHPALGQSPRDSFATALDRAGQRPSRLIPYDDQFRIMTLPTTSRGTALISPGKGVKINHLHYWSTIFRDPGVERKQVPVRYDPFDPGIAYAYVGNRWVCCCSEHYLAFRGRSEKELMIAAAEVRSQSREHCRSFPLTAHRLADFLSSVQAEETLLMQRLKDFETKRAQSIFEQPAAELAPKPPASGDVPNQTPSSGPDKPAQVVEHQPQVYEEY